MNCPRCGSIHPSGMEGDSCLAAARYAVEHDRRFYSVDTGVKGYTLMVERQGNQIVQAVLVLTNDRGASFPGIPMTAEELSAFAHSVQRLSTFPMSTLAKSQEVLTIAQEGPNHATDQ